MKRLRVEAFGPIRSVDVTFGDLTVLVGPQASGKSLFVQLFKAVKDAGAIRADLKSYGFDWIHGQDSVRDYCSIYFGGGLEGIIHRETSIHRDGKRVDVSALVKPPGRARSAESVFLIPAQRVLVLQDGWPRPFMGYSEGDPYCMRRFSEELRLFMEKGLGHEKALFPERGRLKVELRESVNDAIYVDARLNLETSLRKRLVLTPHEEASSLPYSAWSAGQREFTPLLVGLYSLMPLGKVSRKKEVDTVIVEEPEMGLHPQAIVSFGLLVLELLHRGYRVVLSTHSPVILDLVWAIRQLAEGPSVRAIEALRQIFDLKRTSPPVRKLFESALGKDFRVYFFERHPGPAGVVVRDISSLDPGDEEDEGVSGWGGLSGFSGKIATIVGQSLAEGGAR